MYLVSLHLRIFYEPFNCRATTRILAIAARRLNTLQRNTCPKSKQLRVGEERVNYGAHKTNVTRSSASISTKPARSSRAAIISDTKESTLRAERKELGKNSKRRAPRGKPKIEQIKKGNTGNDRAEFPQRDARQSDNPLAKSITRGQAITRAASERHKSDKRASFLTVRRGRGGSSPHQGSERSRGVTCSRRGRTNQGNTGRTGGRVCAARRTKSRAGPAERGGTWPRGGTEQDGERPREKSGEERKATKASASVPEDASGFLPPAAGRRADQSQFPRSVPRLWKHSLEIITLMASPVEKPLDTSPVDAHPPTTHLPSQSSSRNGKQPPPPGAC